MRRAIVLLYAAVSSAMAEGQSNPCTVKTARLHFDTLPRPAFTLLTSFGKERVPMQVDTGSTGIVVGRPHVPQDAPSASDLGLSPYIVYTSSNVVEKGQWVYVDIQLFNDPQGPPAVTIPQFPVLAVDQICTTRNGSTDPASFQCPSSTPASRLREIGMMGVGFDRGATMGPPITNLFLNLPQMKKGAMQHGYVISAVNGITLGMNDADVAGFRFVPLAQGAGPLEWYQAQGCVTIEGGGVVGPATPVCGSVLVDTGVDSMFLTYAAESEPAFRPPFPPNPSLLPEGDIWHCPVPCDKRQPRTCTIHGCPPAAAVTVSFPAGPDFTPAQEPVFTYRATAAPQFDPAQPSPAGAHVRGVPALSGRGNVFVNTSRQLLRVADYLYDADCGRIGFRPR